MRRLFLLVVILAVLLLSIQPAEARWHSFAEAALFEERTCRNGISYGLGSNGTGYRSLDARIENSSETIAVLEGTLQNNPISNGQGDPNGGHGVETSLNAEHRRTFYDAVPWNTPLNPGTVVEIAGLTYPVEDCYLPDFAISMSSTPTQVPTSGVFNYNIQLSNPTGPLASRDGDSDPRQPWVFNTTSWYYNPERKIICRPDGDADPCKVADPAGDAGTYPATMWVGGLSGRIKHVTLSLRDVTYSRASDLDILLVGPQGQKVMLMSDAGGSTAINIPWDYGTRAQLTFADGGATLPESGAIGPGEYKPTDYQGGENLPGPAPTRPYSTGLSAFNGTNPNGEWRLYVADDQLGSGEGSIGWIHLSITTTAPAATVTQTLPNGVTFNNATGYGWECSYAAPKVTCTRNTTPTGTIPPISVEVSAPKSPQTLTSTVVVEGPARDLNEGDNTARVQTTISAPPVTPKVWIPMITQP